MSELSLACGRCVGRHGPGHAGAGCGLFDSVAAIAAAASGWTLGRRRAGTPGSLSDYLDAIAASYGLESEPVVLRLQHVDDLQRAAPFVLALSPQRRSAAGNQGGPRGGGAVTPDGSPRRIARQVVADALAAPVLAPLQPVVERLLSKAGITSPARRETLTRVAVQRRLSIRCWVVLSSCGWPLRPWASSLARQRSLRLSPTTARPTRRSTCWA